MDDRGRQGHGEPSDVLTTPAPSLDESEAERLLAEHFALAGRCRRLASERDQNFHVVTTDGGEYVLKVSNAAEDPAVLDFQVSALDHVSRTAPSLPVPHLLRGADGRVLQRTNTPEGECLVRMVSYLPGIPVAEVRASAALRESIGGAIGQLGRALRGFFHSSARHPLLWDVRQADSVARLVRHIDDGARRAQARDIFEHHASCTKALLSRLRAQVIHNDANPDNLLVAPEEPTRLTGIIDFGDMVHGPLINDLAVTLAYQLVGEDDPLAAATDLVAAYHAIQPLESEEADVLFDLVMLRLAMSVTICAWRAKDHPDNVDYILGNHERYWQTLDRLGAVDARDASIVFRRACGYAPAESPAPGRVADDAGLRERRRRLLGPGLRLSYEEPLHIVRGEGVWLYDAAGRAYLDAYNNVPSVGHSHPAVLGAISAQMAELNTNTRYLHERILEYAERLGELLPGRLSVCYFVCTGSEANDLAWQIAKACSGGDGAIVTEFAYHGNTTAVAQLSPEELGGRESEDWVTTVPAPDCYRGPNRGNDAGPRYAEHLDEAIDRLAARGGRRPAAFFVDTIYSSDGIHVAPPGYLAEAWARVRAAGGLCVADEVQAGFARTGDHFWGFQQQRVVPDIVTLGKPMGNGHPLAAVVTTPEIARQFASHRSYFNTFGGNPVSCAAGLAVLDVLEREELQENAAGVGSYLRRRLEDLRARHEPIGDVRGAGLFLGVDLVKDRASREADEATATRVMNDLRRQGVLVGRTGRRANVLKIRPPLVFSRENADQFVETLDAVLARL